MRPTGSLVTQTEDAAWEANVAYNEKIDTLVATVREIQHEFRPKVNDAPGGNPPGNPLHQAMADLRDHEQQVSRSIRTFTIADLTAREQPGQIIEPQPISETSGRTLLSQFATAREAILSILRTLDDEQWTEEQKTEDGTTTTILQQVDHLIASDKEMVKKLHEAAAQTVA